MNWLCGILVALFVLDGLRLRARLSALRRLPSSHEPFSMDYRVIAAPGVTVDDDTARAAIVWARDHKLKVLDLVPGNLSAGAALGLAQMVDTRAYRYNLFGVGRTAGHAIIVERDVVERAHAVDFDPKDGVAFVTLGKRLKLYAAGASDFVVAPDLAESPQPASRRFAVSKAAMDGMAMVGSVALPLLLALIVWGILSDPIWGIAALVAYHFQPVLALAGQAVHPRRFWLSVLLRSPLDVLDWMLTVTGRWRPPGDSDPVEGRRSKYAQLLAHGTDAFFEPRRPNCPLCGHAECTSVLDVPDLFQHKPGRFNLDCCASCGHIFQNPRLSLEGLSFYYGDFYDGLGEEIMAGVFGFSAEPYEKRARLVEGHLKPQRWLDVGGGHGHFCCAAKQLFPETQFDCLDMSESVEEAERRRWATQGYRGLFPDLAPGIAGQYDMLSMSHYLEHVREPHHELKAAHIALADGGHLMIEVPDPASRLGSLMGRFWLPCGPLACAANICFGDV